MSRSRPPRKMTPWSGVGALMAALILCNALPEKSRLGASGAAATNTILRGGDPWRVAKAILSPRELGAYRASLRGDAQGSAWETVTLEGLAGPPDGRSPYEAALEHAEGKKWVECLPMASGNGPWCVSRYKAARKSHGDELAVEIAVLRDDDGSRVKRAVDAATAAGIAHPELTTSHAPFLQRADQKRMDEVERVLGLATLWSLRWPVGTNVAITSPYGERTHPVLKVKKMHDGVDLATPSGTPLKAPATAKVLHVGNDSVSGLYVVLDHGHAVHSVACHLSEAMLKAGASVEDRAVYAKTGASGRVTGPHLHFGIRVGGRFVDPVAAARREGGQ
ncbi:MAG: M23 family metallopeptidase [Myxococcota bacterium]